MTDLLNVIVPFVAQIQVEFTKNGLFWASFAVLGGCLAIAVTLIISTMFFVSNELIELTTIAVFCLIVVSFMIITKMMMVDSAISVFVFMLTWIVVSILDE